jgi:hypothetical protein
MYNLAAQAERTLPPDHPALEALRYYQDEALRAIESRDHGRLARVDGPRIDLPAPDPSLHQYFREALRRAIALETQNK